MAKKIRKEQVDLPTHIQGQYHYNFNYLETINQSLNIGANVQFNSVSGVNAINFKQASTYNATGLWWKNLSQTQVISGIGSLSTGDHLHYLYMGWGNSPWSESNSFRVSERGMFYQKYLVYHSGNLNLNGQYATISLSNISNNISQANRRIIKQRIGVMTDGVANTLNSTTTTQNVTLTNTVYPRIERIWYGGELPGTLRITKTAPVDGDEIIVHGKQCTIQMMNHQVYSPHERTAQNFVKTRNGSIVGDVVHCVHLRFVTNLNAWVVLSATTM